MEGEIKKHFGDILRDILLQQNLSPLDYIYERLLMEMTEDKKTMVRLKSGEESMFKEDFEVYIKKRVQLGKIRSLIMTYDEDILKYIEWKSYRVNK